MGSRNRTSKFERDDRNHRGSSYYYKDNGSDDASSSRSKMPLLQFTTDIDPACFSGPISLPLAPSDSRSPFPSANYRNMDGYGSSESQDRKFSSRRDSGYGYSEEEERRSRRYRDRDYDRDYDRGRDRSRERDRGRERTRDRSYERDDDRRDRERMNDRMRDRDRDWREEIPNNTIMVRGLDTSVNETEIRDEVMRYGLEPKDIRLIREKGTGASRGFAFVEFQLLSEAVRWKELTKVLLLLFYYYPLLLPQPTNTLNFWAKREDIHPHVVS